MFETEVTKFLDDRAVSYEIKHHAEPALTCEAAARERHVKIEQIVKCMVGRDDRGGVYVMLLPGDRTLKIKKIRAYIGGKPVDLIPPDQLSAEFGLTVGAISPIPFIGKAKIFLDPTVLEETDVDISSGDPMAGIELKSADLLRVTQAETVDMISSNTY